MERTIYEGPQQGIYRWQAFTAFMARLDGIERIAPGCTCEAARYFFTDYNVRLAYAQQPNRVRVVAEGDPENLGRVEQIIRRREAQAKSKEIDDLLTYDWE